MFGLRAKARSSGLIGIAQGILIERYDLPDPPAAFALPREASQNLNVPLRVVASAVITAPPPQTPRKWFTGRGTHAAPPAAALLHTYGVDASDRRRVLTSALDEAVALSDAGAGELHLTDLAQDDALVLEEHRGLDAPYWDRSPLSPSRRPCVPRHKGGARPSPSSTSPQAPTSPSTRQAARSSRPEATPSTAGR